MLLLFVECMFSWLGVVRGVDDDEVEVGDDELMRRFVLLGMMDEGVRFGRVAMAELAMEEEEVWLALLLALIPPQLLVILLALPFGNGS